MAGASVHLTMKLAGWNEIVKSVVRQRLVPAAEDIASRCNSAAGIKDGYLAGTEGSGEKQLKRRTWRATVIAANWEAVRDNAKHDRLISNMNIGGL